MKSKMTVMIILALMLFLLPSTALAQNDEEQFTEVFPIEDCLFLPIGTNDYFILKPGRQLLYNNNECVMEGECEELVELEITVLKETRPVSFEIDGKPITVITRVVEEKETVDGNLVEISKNYFAECKGTGDVYYFGEDVDIFNEDGTVTHEGAWLAGVDGATPGIIFPGGAFLLGSRYFQEVAPDVALDRAEHVAMGLTIEVPAGTFEGCVEVLETTPLEPGEESTKIYCPKTGLVIDDEVELVEVSGDHKLSGIFPPFPLLHRNGNKKE